MGCYVFKCHANCYVRGQIKKAELGKTRVTQKPISHLPHWLHVDVNFR